MQRGLLRIGRSGSPWVLRRREKAGCGSGSPEESGVPAPMAAVKLAAGVIFNSEILYGALKFWAGLEPH